MPLHPARPLSAASPLLGAFFLCACAITPQIALTEYSPVIDLERVDQAQHRVDLEACRVLGLKAQARYKAQREKEIGEAVAASLIGAAIGAGGGALVSRNPSRGAGTGAIVGGAVGGVAGAGNVDYTQDIAKFGPTVIVDRCMAERGYTILSAPGLGGG